MNEEAGGVVRLLAALVPFAFFIWMFWAFGRRRRAMDVSFQALDELPGKPYRIYTSRFDQIVSGEELPALLRSPTSDRARGWATTDDAFWHLRIEAASALFQGNTTTSARKHLFDLLQRHPEGWAVGLLVDMSGSMRGDPITQVAAQSRWLCDILAEHHIPVALLGFSTMGWHGGRSAEEWRLSGKPKRPGRLCALLHMQFKDFDRPLKQAAWDAMLHPDALRENVDGEALLWAAELLRERHEQKRLLIILSDGASVDDATLMHNGPSYLERHLIETINDIVQDHDLLVGAIGVGFAVDRYYPTAFAVQNLNDLATAMVDMIDELLGADGCRSRILH